mgnify:CR=1 FL=1
MVCWTGWSSTAADCHLPSARRPADAGAPGPGRCRFDVASVGIDGAAEACSLDDSLDREVAAPRTRHIPDFAQSLVLRGRLEDEVAEP